MTRWQINQRFSDKKRVGCNIVQGIYIFVDELRIKINFNLRVKEKIVKEKEDLKDLIVSGMKEKKATNITIIDLKSIKNAVADYFIICTGGSDTQIDAIADSIEEEVYKGIAQNPWRKEGKTNKEWILLDYVQVVAHVFKRDRRQFYGLEELWGDAKIINIED
ncbi:MAG: ribosome silencing factor [Sporocytophaga sp.]|nr:ribosome silencing factor [Sporocytophaga sp.]